MLKRISAIILSFLIMLGCTACSSLPIDSSVTADDEITNFETISKTESGTVNITTEATDIAEPSENSPSITDGEKVIVYDDIGADVDIKASYPVVNLSENAIGEHINQQIVNYIDSLYEKYYVKDNLFANDTLRAVTKYEISLFSEKYISIHFFSELSGGGSPQYVEDKAFTFDIKTGEIISLLDLYSADKIAAYINDYFDGLDESLYPMLFSLDTKEQVRKDFLQRFNPESERADFYNSYYFTENTLFLFAGWYKGYTFDIKSPVNGDRSFIVEINVGNVS